MNKTIDLKEAARRLKELDDILVLSHEHPDGDAAGSAYALVRALRKMGKRAQARLGALPEKNEFMREGLSQDEFEFKNIVCVDTPDTNILYTGGVNIPENFPAEMSIDHHHTNLMFAKYNCLDSTAAAASEIVLDIISEMGVEIDAVTASCLYVGIATDTGCFRYGNTTARTFRSAAKLAETGIDIARINKVQFETKSKEFVELEKLAVSSLETFMDGKCAMLVITHDMLEKTGADDDEIQSLCALPVQIEGVLAAATLKERNKGRYRISFRTNENADASLMASMFGGGGHKAAAGCSHAGSLDETAELVKNAMATVLKKQGLI